MTIVNTGNSSNSNDNNNNKTDNGNDDENNDDDTNNSNDNNNNNTNNNDNNCNKDDITKTSTRTTYGTYESKQLISVLSLTGSRCYQRGKKKNKKQSFSDCCYDG